MFSTNSDTFATNNDRKKYFKGKIFFCPINNDTFATNNDRKFLRAKILDPKMSINPLPNSTNNRRISSRRKITDDIKI